VGESSNTSWTEGSVGDGNVSFEISVPFSSVRLRMSNADCSTPRFCNKTFDPKGEMQASVGPRAQSLLCVFDEVAAVVDSIESRQEIAKGQQQEGVHVACSTVLKFMNFWDRLREHINDSDCIERTRMRAWKLDVHLLEELFVETDWELE
jgi:hypothetical protein